MASKKQRIRSSFNLGGEQAEADALLEDAFYDTGDFEVIESRTESKCFIIGRTGAGKSAALTRIEDVHREHVIRINPEDLSSVHNESSGHSLARYGWAPDRSPVFV